MRQSSFTSSSDECRQKNPLRFILGPLQTNTYLLPGGILVDPAGQVSGSIKKVINTHYHFDHSEANSLYEAEFYIHELDEPYLSFDFDHLLKEKDVIDGWEVIHTPGHSPGSICLMKDDVILTGDTLFYQSYGRTDLPGGSEEDMMNSLDRLNKKIKPGMLVCPGHGPTFRRSSERTPLFPY